ncbi:SH3 domain-containing protein [Demequina salsinemoris]|uniref:SH3 domain-containing protein n=1 Tax=Demequina salsinemoris TaxID=577470 RepID=UPI00078270F1|nr:SH3 domain-containing protein [Demequina salsinemoris]
MAVAQRLDGTSDPGARAARGWSPAFAIIVAVLIAVLPTPALAAVEAGATRVPTATDALEAPRGTKLWVAGKDVALRNEASSSSRIAFRSQPYTTLKATGRTSGDWVQVVRAGITGWVQSSALTTTAPGAKAARVMVTASSLSLRSGPSTSSRVKVTASRGTAATLTGLSVGNWWQVKIKGTVAWAPRKRLALIAGTAPAAATHDTARGNVWVMADTLALRSGPSTSRGTTVTAYEGARAYATGEASGTWMRVQIGSVRAWAPKSSFTASKPSGSLPRVWVTAASLALRAKPSTSSAVTGRVVDGTKGVFTGVVRNGWWLVAFDGTKGWTRPGKVSVGGYWDADALLSVARSQIGYLEPSRNVNKYNDWIGANYAWCHVFVAWSFWKAGYAAGVPKKALYADWAKVAERSGALDRTPTLGEMKPGDVLLFDVYPYNGPTHAGIVDHVSGGYVYAIEGNYPTANREDWGVFLIKRPVKDVYAILSPTEYAAATM